MGAGPARSLHELVSEAGPQDPELVIGVVTPVGTDTTDFVSRIRGSLAEWSYDSATIKLSDHFASPKPTGPEHEDERIHRLIGAGNDWCRQHESVFGVGPIAIEQIRAARVREHRRRGRIEEPTKLIDEPVQRFAYLLHSLKRPGEVDLLRWVYGSAFILLATQASLSMRLTILMNRLRDSRNLTELRRHEIAQELIDTDERETDEFGQYVAKTYPEADVFLDEDGDPKRGIAVLFGDGREAPTIAEYATFVAWGASARSLTASRRVGAAIVQNESVVAVGMNEVPDISGLSPDTVLGYDYSELEKQRLAEAAVGALAERTGWLSEQRASQYRDNRLDFMRDASETLRSSKLSDVIEYQRAVHAEMWAILDATRRGVALHEAIMYGTTYPCHLCWKHIFTSGIKEMYYIEGYPKSQALSMYEPTAGRLKPYVGVAPHKYMDLFFHRPLPRADDEGHIRPIVKETAQPLLGEVSEETYRAREVSVVRSLSPSTEVET